jgi:hypothetical protein
VEPRNCDRIITDFDDATRSMQKFHDWGTDAEPDRPTFRSAVVSMLAWWKTRITASI